MASTRAVTGTETAAVSQVNNTANPAGAGYITKWNSMQDARFLSALLKDGINVRFSETPFENENKKFAAGSLVITKSDNRELEDFDSRLVDIANKHNRELTAAASGFSSAGPDFGSSQMRTINKPRIGVLRGDGTSSLNFGEIWYFFEQDLNYPIIAIGTDDFNASDLLRLDILILPSGNYRSLLNKEMLKELQSWVKSGGKVIAIEGAVAAFAGKEGFELKENKPETEKDTAEKGNLIPYNEREREQIKDLITGSIIKTRVDNTHPMAFGYDDNYFSLKQGSSSYSLLKKGYNVAYLDNNPLIVSGFAGSEASKKIKNSLTYGVEPMGRGSFIYVVDNPLFRAFWENGKLFFVNAVFFVDNDDKNRY